MAQVPPLVREGVLEQFFSGEELEIRVVDPALAHSLIGQPVKVLEQQQPDHEAGLDPRPPVLAVERCDLAVDPIPIDLAGKQNQLVLQVDDLVQPRPEQIVRSRRLVLLRPHRSLRCATESWPAAKGNPKTIAGFWVLKPPIPAISNAAASEKQNPPQSVRGLFTDDTLGVRYFHFCGDIDVGR
jgi:hypothetical protein